MTDRLTLDPVTKDKMLAAFALMTAWLEDEHDQPGRLASHIAGGYYDDHGTEGVIYLLGGIILLCRALLGQLEAADAGTPHEQLQAFAAAVLQLPER